jgi:hypothetical protein
MESEGHEEKYRAVIDGETKAFSFTHRTKVSADGTEQKNNA